MITWYECDCGCQHSSEVGSYYDALDTNVIHTRVGVDDVTDATFGTIESFSPFLPSICPSIPSNVTEHRLIHCQSA